MRPEHAAQVATALGLVPALADNDGVVPFHSQLWGTLVWSGLGDHLDVLGHYRGHHDGGPRETRHHDWLASGSEFSHGQFAALMDAIATECSRDLETRLQRGRHMSKQQVDGSRSVIRVRRAVSAWLCTLVLAGAGCHKKDNSEYTDEAADDLNKAEGAAAKQQQGVAANEADIEHGKREVVAEQQALDDKQALLAQQRAALGSAQVSLEAARGAYAAAVAERFAKLDAQLATLSKRTDAASTDASAGLHARRDLLAAKLKLQKTTADPGWATYTKDVDTTFDAIEHDLQIANR
jgi:hypothetical protein